MTGNVVSGQKAPLGRESRLRMLAFTPSLISGSPVMHNNTFLYYYRTKTGKNDVTEEKTRGEMTSQKKNAGKITSLPVTSLRVKVASGHVTDVTFDQGRSLPVDPPQIRLCPSPYTTALREYDTLGWINFKFPSPACNKCILSTSGRKNIVWIRIDIWMTFFSFFLFVVQWSLLLTMRQASSRQR